MSPVLNCKSVNDQSAKPNFNFINYIMKHHERIQSGSNYCHKKSQYMVIPNEIIQQSNTISDNEHTVDNDGIHDMLLKAKFMVNDAIKNKMIFSIYGPYEKIRCILRERGWIEKKLDEKTLNNVHKNSKSLEIDLSPNVNGDIPTLKTDSIIIQDQERLSGKPMSSSRKLHDMASQLAFNCVPDFIWSLKMNQIEFKHIKPHQIINHFRKSGSFTTKTGLIKSFNSLRWYEKDPDEVFPRSYIISDEDEKKAFLNDYYLTACVSMIQLTADVKELMLLNSDTEINNNSEKLVNDTNNSKYSIKKVMPCINYNVKGVGFSKYQIDRRYPEMAVNYCQLYLKYFQNKDLDSKELVFCSNKKWDEFFENFWNVTFEGYGIQCTESIRDKCKELCIEFKNIQRQYNLNGTKNIWIVKPGAKSRGRGITCISRFSELDSILRSNSDTFIIQKYIERPFLIYNTKFDIRQWFLVTSWSPLTIWWYNDSYIRFCSQQFTLNDLNEAVHLSNNSIQHKYYNGPRSQHLPQSNMWEWETFEKYLNENGYENIWKKEILPSMKSIITDILLCSQEEIEDRKNSFELYGADFMITEGDLKTWLLEINSSPCMAPTTEVTARLTKSVLEDIIKVILDYPKNIYCDTGQFELLYKQSPFINSIIGKSFDLSVVGNRIRKPVFYSQLTSHDLRTNNLRRISLEENSILKCKLRYIVENCGSYRGDAKSEELVRKHHYRAYTKLVQEIKSMPIEHFSGQLNSRNKKSILQDQNTTKHLNEYIKNSISPNLVNYTVNPSGTKLFHCKDEQSERNLPIIRPNISRIMDKYGQRIGKTVLDRSINTRYLHDNSITSKLQIWKANDANNGRIDRLIKAYMPSMSKK